MGYVRVPLYQPFPKARIFYLTASPSKARFVIMESV